MLGKKILWLVVSSVIMLSLVMAACGPATTPTTPAVPTTPATPVTPTPSLPPAKPASFTTTNLAITPTEVTSGSKATIQVTVANSGELSGSYDVNLKIDGNVEATENITLAGGVSQNVTFTISKSVAKTYSVNVNELSGTFLVKSIPLPPPVVSVPPSTPAVPTTIDVPWEQLRSFLLSANATSPLRNSAPKAGIRVGRAVLRFRTGNVTLNAFSTTDYGEIYVADQKVEGSFAVWSVDVKSYFSRALPLTQLDIRYLHDQLWWDRLTSAWGMTYTDPTGSKIWDYASEVTVSW